MESLLEELHSFQNRHVLEEEQACLLLIKNYKETNGDRFDGFCPPIWDKIMCWNETKAGETALQPCPSYVLHFSPQEKASKQCLINGSWYKRYDNLPSWTNYSQCPMTNEIFIIDEELKLFQDYLPALKMVTEAGHYLSLLSLLVTFTIIISIKKLRCPRNVLHLNLFASFIMRATVCLFWGHLIDVLLLNSDIIYKVLNSRMSETREIIETHTNGWLCSSVKSVMQYFIMANYSWILMEGLYLHNLMFLANFTDSSSISLYILLGWGLPFLFVVSWTVCKVFLENEYCWTLSTNKTIFLLIEGPITTSILVNFILFVRIILALFKKLQSSVCEEEKSYRRLAKAILVLIPHFGVHYLFFLGFQFATNITVKSVWLFCDQIITSFDGFLIALLFFFSNREMRNALHKKWNKFSFRKLKENCHFHGPGCIFSSRYFGDRFRRPRESCYSNSCTIDTTVQSCNREKNRPSTTLIVATQKPFFSRGGINDPISMNKAVKCKPDTSEIKNGFSHYGRDRRWSASDYNTQENAIELKRISISNDNVA